MYIQIVPLGIARCDPLSLTYIRILCIYYICIFCIYIESVPHCICIQKLYHLVSPVAIHSASLPIVYIYIYIIYIPHCMSIYKIIYIYIIYKYHPV